MDELGDNIKKALDGVDLDKLWTITEEFDRKSQEARRLHQRIMPLEEGLRTARKSLEKIADIAADIEGPERSRILKEASGALLNIDLLY